MIFIVEAIFNTLTAAIGAYAAALGDVFTDLMTIFYAENQLTLMGTLFLLGIGVGVVKWAFNLITGLIRL